MSLGSFATGALTDVSASDVDRMLRLDETLYVEHKRGIGKDEAFQIVKAVASFANTAGGWLLVWVHGSAVVPLDAGDLVRSQLEGAPTLVDAIRDRVRGRIDPMPPFEARIVQHASGPVGVIRVYESSDTPHVALQDGAIYVREVAGDRDAKRPRKSGDGLLAERDTTPDPIRSMPSTPIVVTARALRSISAGGDPSDWNPRDCDPARRRGGSSAALARNRDRGQQSAERNAPPARALR